MTDAAHPAPSDPAPGPWSALPGPVRARTVLNVLNLSTPLGLAIARAGGARVRRGPRGLVLADGFGPRALTAAAITIGDVVITRRDWDVLTRRRPALLAHEERHAWQWAACGGLAFVPLYAAGTVWSWLRTGDRAARNPFERGAGLADGGYRDVPVRARRPVSVSTPAAARVAR